MARNNNINTLETFKKEYESNNGNYIKWIILRFGIILSVVLVIYSGVSKMEKNNVKEQVEKIKSLAYITNSVPESEDIFIQNLYLEPAAKEVKKREAPILINESTDDTTQLAKYYRIKLSDSIIRAKINLNGGKNADSLQTIKQEAVVLQDSLFQIVGSASDEQWKIVANMETASAKEFIVNFSFISGSIDLRYGIFFIPLFFILSEIYFFLIRIKCSILSYNIKDHFKDEQILTLNFIRQPNLFLSNLIRFLELIVLAIFLKTIIIFSGSADVSATAIYLASILILIYYAVIFANLFAIEINPDEYVLKKRKEIFIKIFVWMESLTHKFISKVNKIFSISFGSVLLIITLFTTVTFNGCEKQVNGYEFFTSYKALHFDPIWWILGGNKPSIENNSLGSITSTHAYLISILMSIISLALLAFPQSRRGKKRKYLKLYGWLLLVSGSCFFIFTFLFSYVGSVVITLLPFFDLALVFAWILFLQRKWLERNPEDWRFNKIKMIAIVWPFIAFNIWYFALLPFALIGQLILYTGLLFMVIGFYKYSSMDAETL